MLTKCAHIPALFLLLLSPVAGPALKGELAQRPLQGVAPTNVGDLDTASDPQRQAIAGALIRRHDATILALEDVLKKTIDAPSRKAAAATAATLLGRFHAVHAAGLLAAHLVFLPYPERVGELDNEAPYPCVRALISIGMPSLGPVTTAAEETDDVTTLELSAAVIRGVLGTDLGLAYLHGEARKTTDIQARSRLSRMYALMQADAGVQAPAPAKPGHKNAAGGGRD